MTAGDDGKKNGASRVFVGELTNLPHATSSCSLFHNEYVSLDVETTWNWKQLNHLFIGTVLEKYNYYMNGGAEDEKMMSRP